MDKFDLQCQTPIKWDSVYVRFSCKWDSLDWTKVYNPIQQRAYKWYSCVSGILDPAQRVSHLSIPHCTCKYFEPDKGLQQRKRLHSADDSKQRNAFSKQGSSIWITQKQNTWTERFMKSTSDRHSALYIFKVSVVRLQEWQHSGHQDLLSESSPLLLRQAHSLYLHSLLPPVVHSLCYPKALPLLH